MVAWRDLEPDRVSDFIVLSCDDPHDSNVILLRESEADVPLPVELQRFNLYRILGIRSRKFLVRVSDKYTTNLLYFINIRCV